MRAPVRRIALTRAGRGWWDGAVTERDPFGRLPNEDPLAGLGSRTNGTESLAASEPAATDESSEQASSNRLRAAASRRSAAATRLNPSRVADAGRWIVKVVVVLGVLAVIAGVAGALLLAQFGEVSQTPAPRIARIEPAPHGLDSRSLLLRRNLVPALQRLRASGLGQLRTLRIAPQRIDATLLARDDRLRAVRLRFDGRLSGLGSSGAGAGRLVTIPFSRIDATAPSHLVRDAARRVGRPVTEVGFVFLRSAGSSQSWTVVMRGGGRFVADAHGRITRRVS
jgi:hypothetical protein